MEFLTVKETAQLLRVSPITVRRYIASGQLAAERVGRGIRIRREAIKAFVTPVGPSPVRRRADGAYPSTILEGLGISAGIFRSGEPTIIAELKHEDLADAFADLHEDDDPQRAKPVPRPLTVNDPRRTAFAAGEADEPGNSDSDEELPTVREQMGNIFGIGRSGRPSDVSANKYEYFADAILASDHDDEDDHDPGVIPGKPTSEDDPLWSIIGMATSDEPNDVASNKHKYLADAILADKSMG